MERIAIIDHEDQALYIEDISKDDLAKYNGNIEAYIKDNYSLNGKWSWGTVKRMNYIQQEDKDPIDIFDLESAFV